MGLAEKQLLTSKISVNFEVSHARISTAVVTSSISGAEMTQLGKRPVLQENAPSEGNHAGDLEERPGAAGLSACENSWSQHGFKRLAPCRVTRELGRWNGSFQGHGVGPFLSCCVPLRVR